jgi:Domain of unknown function (DUF4352)
MQPPPENPEQPSNPYQPQPTEPGVPPPPSYQQQPYTQYQQPYQPPQPGMYPPLQQPKKRNRALFWIGGGCLALIVLGIIFAVITGVIAGHVVTTTSSNTSSSSSSSSGNQVSKVGGTITLNGVQATLESAKVYNGGAYNSPNPGNEYVLVKVHLHNTSSNDETYNIEDFHLKSGTGNITDPDSLSFDTSLNGLNSGTLAANGGTADGDIVFQMKIGDHKAELTWQPSFFQNAGDNGWILLTSAKGSQV